jgi:hypothetical protein
MTAISTKGKGTITFQLCEICGKKAKWIFSPDLDIRGLGACKKHLEDMRLAYYLLVSDGEKAYKGFIKATKDEEELEKRSKQEAK